MADEIRNLLGDEIEKEVKNLGSLEPGSTEHTAAVESLTKLYKLRLEEIKIDEEYNDKYNRRIMEDEHHIKDNELKERQFDRDSELKERQIDNEASTKDRDEQLRREQLYEQRKDRWINFGLQLGLTLVSVVAYDCWYRRGLKFEETGTVGSPMTRNLISRMLPKR